MRPLHATKVFAFRQGYDCYPFHFVGKLHATEQALSMRRYLSHAQKLLNAVQMVICGSRTCPASVSTHSLVPSNAINPSAKFRVIHELTKLAHLGIEDSTPTFCFQ